MFSFMFFPYKKKHSTVDAVFLWITNLKSDLQVFILNFSKTIYLNVTKRKNLKDQKIFEHLTIFNSFPVQLRYVATSF